MKKSSLFLLEYKLERIRGKMQYLEYNINKLEESIESDNINLKCRKNLRILHEREN